jgi:hypothetical protein
MEVLMFLILALIQFIVILIICDRTSHIESITNNISRIEKQLELLSKHFIKEPSNTLDSQMNDEELMKIYGITFKNDKYHFQSYKYDKLQDAINFVKHNNKI